MERRQDNGPFRRPLSGSSPILAPPPLRRITGRTPRNDTPASNAARRRLRPQPPGQPERGAARPRHRIAAPLLRSASPVLHDDLSPRTGLSLPVPPPPRLRNRRLPRPGIPLARSARNSPAPGRAAGHRPVPEDRPFPERPLGHSSGLLAEYGKNGGPPFPADLARVRLSSDLTMLDRSSILRHGLSRPQPPRRRTGGTDISQKFPRRGPRPAGRTEGRARPGSGALSPPPQ
jgi:hypothetical protein